VAEGLGHRLDQLLIVTSWRSDGNPKGYRLQHVIKCGRGYSKNQQSSRQQQQ
jgi:hypothetical protein